MIIESFDGSLYVNILDTLYLMEEVPEHESFSKEFDDEIEENKPSVKKKYIPPMTHPWKKMSFNNYVQANTVLVLMFNFFWDIFIFA